MEEVIVLSSDNEDSSSSPSSPSSASDMEIDPIEIEHNTTEQFVPKDNQTLQKIDLKTVTSLSAFLDPMTDFGHWENMKYNNYRKARVHATINQIYGNPIEQRNYRDLKARVNLKSVKRNSNTSVLSGVASLIDPCELASGDFRAGACLACFNKEQHCRLITETLLSIIIRLSPLHLMPTTGYSGHRDWLTFIIISFISIIIGVALQSQYFRAWKFKINRRPKARESGRDFTRIKHQRTTVLPQYYLKNIV
ncbi:hypothetical protein GQX74_002011 [Glossina fuscipes]|nr:hypothetical protein GQX74_002011 [Glossina fuscipes]